MLMRYTMDDYINFSSDSIENTLSEQIIVEFEELYKLVDEYIASLPPPLPNEYTHHDKKKHRKHYKHHRKNDGAK